MTTLCGTLLQSPSPDQCTVTPNAAVTIGKDGRIAEVDAGGRAASVSRSKDTLGGGDCWILPGFIDAHLHLPQWDRRGIDGMPLFDWLSKVAYPAEARLVDADFAEKLADQFVTGLVANGTTTVAAYGSPFAESTDRVFSVFERRGYRAVYGMVLNDTDCPSSHRQETDKVLDESRGLAAKWHNAADGRLKYAFSPRTPIHCSEKLMRGAAALADMLNCYIQTHVAETLLGVEKVRERFPDQLDEIELFDEMGLLTPRTLLGHGVYLSQQQRHQIAETRTIVIHCPTANLFLESGLMDYVSLRMAGVRVALGSGVAGGPDPFMPRVAVDCINTAKAVKVHGLPRGTQSAPKPAEAFWALTRGAAASLGLADRIGSIQPGFDADCLVVKPEPWIADLPGEQQPSALLYTLRPDQIQHVFIAGQRVGP
ncbi:MAG: amidohydrolase family protein [Planctomycetes bacterium]|nr:amidohydrolase family protein [Planctomycetota bacterium]